jgi:uncharacterized protein (TIGR03435 family)
MPGIDSMAPILIRLDPPANALLAGGRGFGLVLAFDFGCPSRYSTDNSPDVILHPCPRDMKTKSQQRPLRSGTPENGKTLCPDRHKKAHKDTTQGRNLMEERERACDEAALSLGNEPRVYAEGILNVCKSYPESPLQCVSGVTGSDLKKRIRTILMEQVAGGLSFARKVTLMIAAVAAIAVPILVGIISAPSIRAQSQTQTAATAAAPQEAAERKIAFDVASIKPVQDMRRLDEISSSGSRLDMEGVTVKLLIMYAYDVKNYRVPGTPALSAVNEIWYDIQAEAADDVTPTKNEFRKMVQSLLADRFKLTIHHEMREMPVYALVVDKNGPKFKESAPDAKFSGRGGVDGRNQTLTLTKATMEQFTEDLYSYANRPIVDKTGLTGTYDIKLEAAIENSNPDESDIISIFTAVQKQLGLKLVPQRGMVDVIVVDHVEMPSKN